MEWTWTNRYTITERTNGRTDRGKAIAIVAGHKKPQNNVEIEVEFISTMKTSMKDK